MTVETESREIDHQEEEMIAIMSLKEREEESDLDQEASQTKKRETLVVNRARIGWTFSGLYVSGLMV